MIWSCMVKWIKRLTKYFERESSTECQDERMWIIHNFANPSAISVRGQTSRKEPYYQQELTEEYPVARMSKDWSRCHQKRLLNKELNLPKYQQHHCPYRHIHNPQSYFRVGFGCDVPALLMNVLYIRFPVGNTSQCFFLTGTFDAKF